MQRVINLYEDVVRMIDKIEELSGSHYQLTVKVNNNYDVNNPPCRDDSGDHFSKYEIELMKEAVGQIYQEFVPSSYQTTATIKKQIDEYSSSNDSLTETDIRRILDHYNTYHNQIKEVYDSLIRCAPLYSVFEDYLKKKEEYGRE